MKKLFKSEVKISSNLFEITKVPKNVIEKEFIINFFKELPIESLKELINFKKLDFKNRELWGDYSNIDMLKELQKENVIKFTCELYLNTK